MSTPEVQEVDEFQDRLLRLEAMMETGQLDELGSLLAGLHPSDIADLIEHFEEEDERVLILDTLPAELASETLAEMEAHQHPEEILVALEPERIGALLEELSNDDAADIIGELAPADQARVLATMAPVDAGELRELLAYPEESAGGIMTTEVVAISIHLTAGEAIQEVRRQAREIGGDFYNIFVVDLMRRLQGQVGIQELVLADPDQRIGELVEPPVVTVPVDMDQEEVGRFIGRYNEPSVPVVGPAGVLLGRITWDDVLDVIEAEQTEDLLRLAGIAEEEVQGEWFEAVRARLPWLILNTLTAAVGALVIYQFTDTIDQMLALAALLPVIAALGGNAGTQALAVTVRRLALTREPAATRWRVAGKEVVVGLLNGLALGIVVGLGSWFLFESTPMLGLVVLLAMWGNLVVASVAGAMVPVFLERVGADPAVASSVFVTAVTDVAGFFLLLGLATRLLI